MQTVLGKLVIKESFFGVGDCGWKMETLLNQAGNIFGIFVFLDLVALIHAYVVTSTELSLFLIYAYIVFGWKSVLWS